MTLREALRILGPRSLLGPGIAGLAFGLVFLFVIVPPLLWATAPLFSGLFHIFGWWWRLWLPGFH